MAFMEKFQQTIELLSLPAGVGVLGATARIIATKLPFKLAVTTLALGIVMGCLAGLGLEGSGLRAGVQHMIVATAAIAAKEIVEWIIRLAVGMRDRAHRVADGLTTRIGGKDKPNDR